MISLSKTVRNSDNGYSGDSCVAFLLLSGKCYGCFHKNFVFAFQKYPFDKIAKANTILVGKISLTASKNFVDATLQWCKKIGSPGKSWTKDEILAKSGSVQVKAFHEKIVNILVGVFSR